MGGTEATTGAVTEATSGHAASGRTRRGPGWRALAVVVGALALGACGVGTWSTNPSPSPVRAIHAALLPTGKVLLVAGSGNQADVFTAGDFRTSVWDPTSDTFSAVTTPWDAFCSGHAYLPDGRLLVAGGTTSYGSASTNNAFAGSARAYTFDPATNTYQRVSNMGNARWYPSLLTLGDGSVLAVAGQGADGLLTHTWQRFTGSGWTANQQPPVIDTTQSTRTTWPMYPGLHLLADGRVFFSGSHTFGGTPPPGVWNLTDNTIHPVGGLPDLGHLDHAMSVLLPPAQSQKVMVIGGGVDDGSDATNAVSIADLTKANPQYTPAAPLDTAKMYVSAVILPDRTVFETGGAIRTRESPGSSYVQSAQIFDPQTGAWTKAADPKIQRGYHSSGLLLPDGRVATFGNNPTDGSFELRIEIYSPDYLTKGPRPTITSAPTDMHYGATYPIATTQSTPIQSLSLVRPMAVTHSADGNQRLVDVPFTVNDDGTLQASITDNPDLAPPGWYMLFAVDTAGVPSVASWVHVDEATTNAPSTLPLPSLNAPSLSAPSVAPTPAPGLSAGG